jgi:carbonic anhydrase
MKQMNFFKHWHKDIPAGFSVFLIALPLCLGISTLSQAPMFSGIIAGIIGGIMVGLISKSNLGVSGPANSTAIIVAMAVQQFGQRADGSLDLIAGFQIVLVAVVMAGFLQILLSLLEAGSIAHFFPSAVVKGMLSGIGILLILKQIPHAFGYDKSAEVVYGFSDIDGEDALTHIVLALSKLSLGAFLIALTSIFTLFFWDNYVKQKIKALSNIPGVFVVILLSILLNLSFGSFYPFLALDETHLVQFPNFITSSVSELWLKPNFDYFFNPSVISLAFSLAIVASLETLLSLQAIDKLDVNSSSTPPNRELFAQGVGNMVSGVLGGLPITQVIVRSSANLASGAVSKLSTVTHGVFLLVSIFLLVPVMNQIPLAALAGILIVVGYRLAPFNLFQQMYRLGRMQFIPFIITLLVIVFFNLLWGIFAGFVLCIYFMIVNAYHNVYFSEVKGEEDFKTLYIQLDTVVSFFAKSKAIQTLENIPENVQKVVIDASKTKFLDYDVWEYILDFDKKMQNMRIQVDLIGINRKFNIKHAFNKSHQAQIKIQEIIQMLKDGNQRFLKQETMQLDHWKQMQQTSDGQAPVAIILSCIDSRVPVETVFDLGIGHVFTTRVAGNVVSDDVLASMEYACKFAGAKLIVVLGHTQCGAVESAVLGVQAGSISQLLGKIEPAILACPGCSADKVAERNVQEQMKQVTLQSPILNQLVEKGEVSILGGMYDLKTGVVTFYE